MAWQQTANLDDVTNRAGLQGVEVNAINNLPDHLTTSATGNASVNSQGRGIMVNAGGTAGDTGKIHFTEARDYKRGTQIFQILFQVRVSSPTTDDVEVGIVMNSFDAIKGTYLDLQREEIQIVDETYALDGTVENNGYQQVNIIIDYDANKIKFDILGLTFKQSVTTDTAGADNAHAAGVVFQSQSDGGADQCFFQWLRMNYLPGVSLL